MSRARPRANCYEGLHPYAANLVRYKAQQLVGRYGFSRDDREDLEQELYLDLLRRLPKFNPQRAGLNTFVARVVDHAVATIIERRIAACRDYRQVKASADDPIVNEGGDQSPLGAFLDASTYLHLTGRTDPESIENLELRADLQRAIDALPSHLRELCRLLVAETVTEISRKTGVPRGTVYERLSKIRAHFERAGLNQYL